MTEKDIETGLVIQKNIQNCKVKIGEESRKIEQYRYVRRHEKPISNEDYYVLLEKHAMEWIGYYEEKLTDLEAELRKL